METRHEIETKLGLQLVGLLKMPEATTQSCPLVILLHGFTGWKQERHIRALADALAAKGIASLRCDAPGSGESEGTFEDDYTMTNYIAVVDDLVNWAQSLPSIDPERIAIWGHSMGGFVALASAVRYPGIKAVCCCQPSSGWKVMEPAAEKTWRETGWATFANSHFAEIRLPYSFLEDRSHYDATHESPKLRVPSLFIAGSLDTDVMPDGVKAMAELAPTPTEYLEFPATHGYKRNPEMLSAITEAAASFFDETL